MRILVDIFVRIAAERVFHLIIDAVDSLVSDDKNELSHDEGKKIKEIIIDADYKTKERRIRRR